MFSPYITFAKKWFPNAKIVLDRFHISKDFNSHFNSQRTAIMKSYYKGKNKNTPLYNRLQNYWKLLLKREETLDNKKTFYSYNYHMHVTEAYIVNDLILSDNELYYSYRFYQNCLKALHDKNSELLYSLLSSAKKNPALETFIPCIKTLTKYKNEVINSLTYEYSNAKVERFNLDINMIKNNAFGISYISLKTILCLRRDTKINL
jgi:transposase